MTGDQEQFEINITRLTEPPNGQFPRPWMTELSDPLVANVFVVGMNQAKGYDTSQLSHKRHVDALFNRRGESCRNVYDELTGFSPSPTRRNTDRLCKILASEGITLVLETNVVCYSTPMSKDLPLPEHRGGIVRGSEIFWFLLHSVKPKVLIVHGAATQKTLGTLLGASLPAPPAENGDPQPTIVGAMTIFIIPSLAPPKWNQWHGWAGQYLTKVAKAVAGAI